MRPLVLLVDDDEDMRLIASHTLGDADPHERFEHRIVADGAEAIGNLRVALAAGRPTLVLCDYRMPLKNGVEVAAETQAQRAGKPVRFLLLSSHGTLDRGHDPRRLGIHAVLEKPFRPAEWRRQFQEVLDAFWKEVVAPGAAAG